MPLLIPQPARSIQWCASLQPAAYGFSSQKQSTGGSTLSDNALKVSPVYFRRPVIIDRYGCEVTTVSADVGATMRPIIYADNGNLYPGLLLLDAGLVTADALGIKEVTIADTYIPAGVVWMGAAWQAQPTSRANVRAISGSPPLASGANDLAQTSSGFSRSTGVGVGAAPSDWASTGVLQRTSIVARMFWRIKP